MSYLKKKSACAILLMTAVVMALALSGCSNGKNTFDIVESYNMTVPSGQTAWLQVDLPTSYGYQQIDDLQTEGSDSSKVTKYDDFQTMLCTIKGTGSEQLVSISYKVTLLGDTENWQMPDREEYLLPDEFVDSDNAAIQAAANPLIVDGDDYETAKNIHQFVTSTVSPRTGDSINQMTMKASEVLDARQGVCADYAHLMTALLRAAGIPARDVGGNAMINLRAPVDWGHPGDAHSWVEFYSDGEWHFADPTWGNNMFDNADTWHLSYGTAMSDIYSQKAIDFYDGIQKQGYFIFGAMTAPLHFTAWCTSDGAMITPRAQIE